MSDRCRCPTCGRKHYSSTGRPKGRPPNADLKERSFGAWLLEVYNPTKGPGLNLKEQYIQNPGGDRPMRIGNFVPLRDYLERSGWPQADIRRVYHGAWDAYLEYRARVRTVAESKKQLVSVA